MAFEPKREEVRGNCPDLHFSRSVMRVSTPKKKMIWAEHVARMEKRRGEYRVLVGKSERSRPPRRRWEYSVKIDLE
jgi:hypothetical protein